MIRKKQTITVDRFDFIQKVINAKHNELITKDNYKLLIKTYEDTIAKDFQNNRYSSSIELPLYQKDLLNF